MEQSSNQRFIQSSQYAAMNDLLFQQFGFQVLANNIREEDTDTHPIVVQCVLRESDVEIWGGFRVRAFIVKLDFLKTHDQPDMCLAILLKNKFTPDVKRLGAPFQLKAYHLQWIQNVLDEDVDGMPVRNSKEIPFIAMYDAAILSEAETLTNNLPLKGSEVTTLLETEGEANAVEEMETPGDQSTVREKSHDLSPADTSQVCQEVSINTVDMNKQLELEKCPTDLKDGNKRERVKGQNEEAPGNVSHEDGDVGQTTAESENCESSEDLDNIQSTDADKRLSAELSTKESNLEMIHPGHKFTENAAITDMSEAVAKATETPCSDTGGASSPDTDKSRHRKAEPNDDDELLPRTQSKRKSAAFKKAPSKKNKLQCEERLTTGRNPTVHAKLHVQKKEAKTLKCNREKEKKRATKKFNSCKDCGIGFTLKKEYSLHMKIHKEDAKKQRFQCLLCGTQFVKRKDLTDHERSEHPGATPYVCEVCHNGFKSFDYLQNHIRKGHRTTPFSCEECNKVFKTSDGLNIHNKRRHLGIWNYQCDTCSKKFFGKHEYEVHLVTHTNLRNFQCEVCGKAYRSKANLRGHTLSHSGKKPHLCNVCGKGFGRRQHLMEHMVVHTKKNDFLCDYCGKSFSNKTNLYVHRRQHTGVHPHVCTICWQGFHRQQGLAKHMEKIHSNVETEPSASLNP
ncbi:zinc finger protein 436-like [Ptychodera flava]|uniref:zinc finger protein 436-like n=1 Tax=Ptychodera flava TaxID=63121 RepID=UPI003969C8BB